MQNIWRLYQLVPEYRSRLIKVLAVNTCISLAGATTPYLFKLIIDKVVGFSNSGISRSKSREELMYLFGVLLAMRFFGAVANYYNERISDNLLMDLLWGIRQKLFGHISQLSIDYYEKTRAGEIIQRLQSGVMEFNRWIQGLTEGILSNILMVIFVFVIFLIKVPLAGFTMLVCAGLGLSYTAAKIRKRRPLQKEWIKLGELASGELTETISHISTVRSFGQEQHRLKQYDKVIKKFRNKRLAAFRIDWRMNFGRSLINGTGIILSLAIVSLGVIDGRYSPGDILLVSLYIQQILTNIYPLGLLFQTTSETETAAERIMELLDVKPTVVDRPNAEYLKSIDSIEFKNVSFSYPGNDRRVLDNISFKLSNGKILALVGISGAGKTTISKLLLRFYEPTEGEILVNGRPINHYIQSSIRQHFGIVMQDVALFNATVEDNIIFAKPNASKEQVYEAAKLAHADLFIDRLPEKYKTLVGERGIKLSGGEKQRVAIARAILRDPEVVILDEATSSLDSESELHVQRGLGELLSNRIAVVIAHRLSTVMRADEILVLNEGRLEEKGTHAELIKNSGLYSRLFKIQSEGHKS